MTMLKDDPLVSVVTVTYNSSEFIESCINSVNSQTYSNVEHVFVDGCSTDSTVEIIKGISKRSCLVVSEPDEGIYEAMNKSFRLCNGSIICFLNSDDQYSGEWVLEEVVNTMRSHNAGFAFGEAVYTSLQGKVVRQTNSSYIPRFRSPVSQIAHPCLFVAKDLIHKYSIFYPTQYFISADLYFQLLLFRNRVPFVYIPKILVKIRLGGISTSSLSSYFSGWKQALAIYLRVFRVRGLSFFVGKLFFKLLPPKFLSNFLW